MTPEEIKGTIDSCGGDYHNTFHIYDRVFYIKNYNYFYHACWLSRDKTFWYLYEILNYECRHCHARFSEKKIERHRAIIAIAL